MSPVYDVLTTPDPCVHDVLNTRAVYDVLTIDGYQKGSRTSCNRFLPEPFNPIVACCLGSLPRKAEMEVVPV
jgi:hypothetical protein